MQPLITHIPLPRGAMGAWATTPSRAITWNRGLGGATTRSVATCAIKARWCLDIRYGNKMEAVELLQEWVRDVGSTAGLTSDNAAIASGSVGVPESRLELEVSFPTLSDLEVFWASVPPAEHKAWSQRLQPLVVHGSPTWEVYRTVEAFPSAPAAPSAASAGAGVLMMPSADEVGRYSAGAAPPAPPPPPSTALTTESGLSVVGDAEEAEIILDWKGDPMRINPGDRMPGARRRPPKGG